MRRTTTALPRVSPIMQPRNSVGYERYWSARKRRAWSDRISFRTIGPRVVPPALRAHADSTSRADSGCRASNAVRPNAATAMRTIRLRPSLTISSIVCVDPITCRHGSQDRCQSTRSNSGANPRHHAAFWGVPCAWHVGKTAESAKRSEEHTSELQSLAYLVCRLLLEKKKKKKEYATII